MNLLPGINKTLSYSLTIHLLVDLKKIWGGDFIAFYAHKQAINITKRKQKIILRLGLICHTEISLYKRRAHTFLVKISQMVLITVVI